MNTYDNILDIFTDRSECSRKSLEHPFRVNNDIVASDAYSLCKISAYKCDKYKKTENDDDVKYPDVSRIIPKVDCDILLPLDILVETIKRVPEEAVVEYKPKERECWECDGSGSVEWTYTDSEGNEHETLDDCPICNGRGYLLKERLKREDRFIAIDDRCFSCRFLIRIAEAMNILNCTAAHILNRGSNGRPMLVRIEDGVEVLIMPYISKTPVATIILE